VIVARFLASGTRGIVERPEIVGEVARVEKRERRQPRDLERAPHSR
jgi:hypothetical protein